MTPINLMPRAELEMRYRQVEAQLVALDETLADEVERVDLLRAEVAELRAQLRLREPDPPASTARLRKPTPSKPNPRRRVAPCA